MSSLGLVHYRDLLWIWTLREIRVRYKQSVLGAAWAILQPLALMSMFTLVFSYIARIPSGGLPYPLFSLSGVLPWTFLATSVNFGVPSLINNLTLVTKTYFPREILPMGAIGAGLLDFVVASSIFVVLLIWYRIPLTVHALWVPAILLPQILLALGVALLGSSLSVFYRDIRFVVPLGLQLWFYATPILYPMSLIPDKLLPIYMLNPMAGIINSYRDVLLNGLPPDLGVLGLAMLTSTLVCVIGMIVFKHLEQSFADSI